MNLFKVRESLSLHVSQQQSPMIHILIFFFFSSSQAAALPCNGGDQAALLQFKTSITKDPKGALSNWKPTTDCCKGWTGITCNRTTGRVTQLKLFNTDFEGTIHQSLGSISRLTDIDLSKNRLTGPIPSTLTKLSELRELIIAYNHGLTGSLPQNIGEMRSLVRIGLQSNKLTGTIPDSFGRLSKLVYCELDDNMLHGPVPDSFTAHTSSLAYLELSKNRLTGLPKNMSKLARLGILYMGSNPLTFQSIAGITTLPFLGELHLSNAGLTGPIPVPWLTGLKLRQSDDFLTSLLDLSRNLITGRIPAELGRIDVLESLQLQENKLSGHIPKSLLRLQNLRLFNVSHNMLQGQIPQGKPLTSFDPSSFAGNAALCGAPLPRCRP